LLALVRRAALKLDRVNSVALVWADDILAAGEGPALEAIMSEIPRDASRVLIAAALSPPVEELAERYLRRARRAGTADSTTDQAPVRLSYVLVSAAGRRDALRRVLDDADPPRAAAFARTERGLAELRDALGELGYEENDASVGVISGESDPTASLIVLYEIPETAAQLRAAMGDGAPRVVALARPRDIQRLRALAGGPVTPLTTRETMERARRRDEIARDELRAEARRGLPDWQRLALEPLLDELDPIDIAAAAMRLRERERERREPEAPGVGSDRPAARPVAWTRLFLTTGSRDNVRAGDLVGMITAESGIPGDKIGKIELRDTHSLVEVAADVADVVVERINGAQVKGRRIVARPERAREDRPARGRGTHRPPRRPGEPPARA
jgi:ATP-dependent RNA helicase DeaD